MDEIEDEVGDMLQSIMGPTPVPIAKTLRQNPGLITPPPQSNAPMVWCEICGSYFRLEPDNFGCPVCGKRK
jgi:rubrerythrin